MFNREEAIEAQREAAKKVRRKKKRTASSTSLASNTFQVRPGPAHSGVALPTGAFSLFKVTLY